MSRSALSALLFICLFAGGSALAPSGARAQAFRSGARVPTIVGEMTSVPTSLAAPPISLMPIGGVARPSTLAPAAAVPEAPESPSVLFPDALDAGQALSSSLGDAAPGSDGTDAQNALDAFYAGKTSDRDLLAAVIFLGGGASPEHLSERMLAALRRAARVRDSSQLKDPAVLSRLQKTLARRMGRGAFETAAGAGVASAKSALTPEARSSKLRRRDKRDMHRGWGWQLLSDNDPAFSEPQYLARLLRESGTSEGVLNLARPQAWTDPWKVFAQAWRAIAPASVDPRSIHFALTGTDANNQLYYIAARAARLRLGLEGRNLPQAEILTFNGAFGGGGGRIGRIGLYNKDPSTEHLRVTSPDTTVFNPSDPGEVAKLKVLEDQALQEIELKVASRDLRVGGLLIESVLGAGGVRFYRPEFLLRVRRLCDRLQIPIFADEVLTGGGRTGKFFAYQHYPGFEPDFVTFGKGLQVSGVAQTDRGRRLWGEMPYRSVTLRQYNEVLLKSAQVMNRIREGGLMEAAARVGAYIVEKLRAQSPRPAPRTETQNAEIARGLGMLIYGQAGTGTRDAHGRLMPPLDFSTAEADLVFGANIPGIELDQRRRNYRLQEGSPVKLTDGSIVEGSIGHGGVQPHYVIDLQAPAMKTFLARAREIGQSDLPFWQKIARIASHSRQAMIEGWEYDSPKYLQLLEIFRKAEKNIPLHVFVENLSGVCREQAMLLHLALEAGGFDSRYLYVHSYEDGRYVEDHAIALVKYQGEDWVADSRSQEYSGRRWADVSRAGGIQPGDTVVATHLPPYRFDPSDTRFETASYPRIWIPDGSAPPLVK